MKQEEVKELWDTIEYEGLANWVQHLWYTGDDIVLLRLFNDARKAMKALDSYTKTIFDEHNLS